MRICQVFRARCEIIYNWGGYDSKKEEWGRGNERDSLGTYISNFDLHPFGGSGGVFGFSVCLAAPAPVFGGVCRVLSCAPLGEQNRIAHAPAARIVRHHIASIGVWTWRMGHLGRERATYSRTRQPC